MQVESFVRVWRNKLISFQGGNNTFFDIDMSLVRVVRVRRFLHIYIYIYICFYSLDAGDADESSGVSSGFGKNAVYSESSLLTCLTLKN